MTTAALGGTADPVALIPGDPGSVSRAAAALRSHGDALHETAAALGRVDRTEGWTGPAADGFRSALDAEPARWRQAGDAFRDAATALEHYRDVLDWAQKQAAEAARLWQEGVDAATGAATDAAATGAESGEALLRAAEDLLTRVGDQLKAAGDAAARVLGQARDLAPTVRKWPEEVGTILGNVADGIVDAAGSLGDAALRNPATALALGATGAVGAAGIAAALAGTSAMAVGPGPGGAAPTPPGTPMPWDDPVVRAKIPTGWGGGRPNRSGVGRRWDDPQNPTGTGIRIDQGNPNNSQTTQQGDHVVVRQNGRIIGRDGEPMPDGVKSEPTRSHIPLEEWKRWREWNHP